MKLRGLFVAAFAVKISFLSITYNRKRVGPCFREAI
jgi:hypothetical protein